MGRRRPETPRGRRSHRWHEPRQCRGSLPSEGPGPQWGREPFVDRRADRWWPLSDVERHHWRGRRESAPGRSSDLDGWTVTAAIPPGVVSPAPASRIMAVELAIAGSVATVGVATWSGADSSRSPGWRDVGPNLDEHVRVARHPVRAAVLLAGNLASGAGGQAARSPAGQDEHAHRLRLAGAGPLPPAGDLSGTPLSQHAGL